jgi:hypothetical protein
MKREKLEVVREAEMFSVTSVTRMPMPIRSRPFWPLKLSRRLTVTVSASAVRRVLLGSRRQTSLASEMRTSVASESIA